MSSALLLLSFALTGWPFSAKDPSRFDTVLENAGILQLTWLLGNEPHFSEVTNPQVIVLRAVGMFDVQMNERAEEKLLRVQSEGEQYELSVLLPLQESLQPEAAEGTSV